LVWPKRKDAFAVIKASSVVLFQTRRIIDEDRNDLPTVLYGAFDLPSNPIVSLIEPAFARLRVDAPEPVLADQDKEDGGLFDALTQMRLPRFAALDAQVVDENLPGFKLPLKRPREVPTQPFRCRPFDS
jgi:hypothetical protein